ncbi:MAG: hypothetical protein JRG77_09115 [Deltaproteobacteria bacterium]|nr:hypothetical protein [Deltaproteobacteria bacterium]MBW2098935.1 hypothetical protein [Deltaproteobacteria bacterium]
MLPTQNHIAIKGLAICCGSILASAQKAAALSIASAGIGRLRDRNSLLIMRSS